MIIDPQGSFANPAGELFVPGADHDMVRLGTMIDRLRKKISDITVTLDSHRYVDVAHPSMHISSEGKHPDPFTIITASDYDNGIWKCFNPRWQARINDYVHQLEATGRYPLCIWPEHTLIAATKKIEAKDKNGNQVIVDGKPFMIDFCGHAVVESVSAALLKWEQENFGIVNYISKGSNILVEHYSILKSEIVDPSDSSTSINTDLIEVLQNADEIIIGGEALSHCIANSIRDICNNFGSENIRKIILLTDCTSNVPNFESLGENFIKEMTAKGMRVTTSTDYLA